MATETEELEQQTELEPAGEEEPNSPPTDEEDGPLVVSFGDETPPEEEDHEAPQWVKDLRKQNREDKRRIRELEKQIQSQTAREPSVKPPGEKPKLEDFDYDSDKYTEELDAWYQRKSAHDAAVEKANKQQEDQVKAWNNQLESYAAQSNEMKVDDFKEAEGLVIDMLTPTQQGMIVSAADKPAMLVYALGKNPDQLKKLAAISDPVKFAFAAAKLEASMKTGNRKAPAPETRVRGNAGNTGSTDKTLDRLRAEAEKTGDYTKVTQYRREMKQAKS